MILYFKALHIIFVVTWFAGLFYIVRLMVYQLEAQKLPDSERSVLTKHLKLWSKKLWYGITWPSAVLATIFGLVLIEPWWGQQWLNIKLLFVAGLWGYHYLIHFRFKALQKDIYKHSGQHYRIMNEGATVFLVSIVFLVVLRNLMGLLWALIGLIVFIVLLLVAIRVYKKLREKNETNS